MARQGLMDDSGYDFFDVSDCSNYESCREDAYNDGYEKGKSDMLDSIIQAEKNKFYCVEDLCDENSVCSECVVRYLELLKEQMNDSSTVDM